MKGVIFILLALALPAFAGDVIVNDEGYHEGNELQRAVFVPIFLPEDMVCSQPVTFVRPVLKEPEPEECEDGVLVISPSTCTPGAE